MKKTLRLHRETVRNLTGRELAQAAGGALPTEAAGNQSYRDEMTTPVPCNKPGSEVLLMEECR